MLAGKSRHPKDPGGKSITAPHQEEQTHRWFDSRQATYLETGAANPTNYAFDLARKASGLEAACLSRPRKVIEKVYRPQCRQNQIYLIHQDPRKARCRF